MGNVTNLVPRPSLAAFFLKPWENARFSMAAKEGAREGLGTRLQCYHNIRIIHVLLQK